LNIHGIEFFKPVFCRERLPTDKLVKTGARKNDKFLSLELLILQEVKNYRKRKIGQKFASCGI